MIFIYATDLHGDIVKYNTILDFAIQENIKIIHLGADLLPKGSDILRSQKNFINGFLKKFYEKCRQNNIEVLAFFGNDDVYTRKKYFLKYASLLDEQPREIDNYYFKAYPFTCDHPFRLKTACKLDYRNWTRPYVDYGVDVNESGFVQIENLDNYFEQKSTIEEDLSTFEVTDTTIVACHMPPCSVELDVCGNKLGNTRVGSQSIYNWIKQSQPCLVLCGHIHESYDISKTWKTYIGKTLVVQPGQIFGKTRFIVFSVVRSSILSNFMEI